MDRDAFLAAIAAAPKGSFFNLSMKADLSAKLTAAARKAGAVLFRESLIQIQARVPYANIAEVRAAMARGDREAPTLPAAAEGIDSVEDGVVFYTPKVKERGLLTGFRPIATLSARFVDGEGREVSEQRARELLQPSYFAPKPTKAEHADKGTGNWRTPYLTTITGVRVSP